MRKIFIIFWLLGFICVTALSQGKDSENLKLKLQNASPKEKVSLYLKLSGLSESYIDKVNYCKRAISISNELKDIELQANSNFTLGIYHYTEGKYYDAERCFTEALGYYNKRNDVNSMMRAYFWLATTNRFWGKYHIAVKYGKLYLDLSVRTKSDEGINDANLILGNIYQAWGDQKQAASYFDQLLKKLGQNNTSNNMGMALLGKGSVYIAKGKIDSALIFYNNSLKIFEKNENKFGKANILKEIGRYHMLKKDYKNAESALMQSLSLFKSMKNNRGVYDLYILEGELYQKKSNSSRAVELYVAAQKLANEMGLSEELAQNYLIISKLYEQKKDNTKAFKYFKLYSTIKDSVDSITHSEQISELMSNSDTLNKQQGTLLKITEKKLQQTKKSKTIILIVLIILCCGFIAALAYVVFKLQNTAKQTELTQKEQSELIESGKRQMDLTLEYATKAQVALLAEPPAIELPHFVFYRPSENVGGDFYWSKKMGKNLIISVADCTGHGVQGAFMSTMGISFLNSIFAEREKFDCAGILEEIRGKVKTLLNQDIFDDKIIDVIEMALCVINTETLEMQYAGAKLPLYRISNGELEIFDAEHNPLGAFAREKPFKNHNIQLKKDDIIYMFTNGYMDQFGGKDGKKFKITHFRDALLAICRSDMRTQKQLLENIFDEWKNSKYEQTDDVLVMGIKV